MPAFAPTAANAGNYAFAKIGTQLAIHLLNQLPEKGEVKSKKKIGKRILKNQNPNYANCNHDHGILTGVKGIGKTKFDIFGGGWDFTCGCEF